MRIILTGATGYVGEGTLPRDGYHKFAIDPKDITKLAKNF